MSEESTFFPTPTDVASEPNAEAPAALFDLAVNRAATTLRGTGTPIHTAQGKAELLRWHARTRFARRIAVADIIHALSSKPAGPCYWAGGVAGQWQAGKAPFP